MSQNANNSSEDIMSTEDIIEWKKSVLDKAKKTALNEIFDILIETTGIHNNQHLDYHRGEFLHIQLRDETSFSSEYWFPASASDNMKLLYNRFNGFHVITQERTAKGIAAAENANARLAKVEYRP